MVTGPGTRSPAPVPVRSGHRPERNFRCGWYVILRVPALQSDEDLAIDLLRKVAVLVHPGLFYDFPKDGYLVLSLITPSDRFREGVKRVLGVLND